jgi:hypothetical protein
MATKGGKPRIIRKQSPPPLTVGNKAKIRECLQLDFEQRCAYCMCHEARLGARHFDIEHFCPRKAGGANDYENLYWSCKSCNGLKWEHWPRETERKRGNRYADPCRELDYGQHLIEKANGMLVAITQCGRYHLKKLVLNRPDLVEWRRKRTEIRELVARCKQEIQNLQSAGKSASSLAAYASAIAEHERQLVIAIPYIPDKKQQYAPRARKRIQQDA